MSIEQGRRFASSTSLRVATRNLRYPSDHDRIGCISVTIDGPFVLMVQAKAVGVRAMDQKTFTLIAGAIFAVVALLHLLRVYMAWPVTIGGWTVPMWVSWIAFVVAGGLSYFGLRHLAQRR